MENKNNYFFEDIKTKYFDFKSPPRDPDILATHMIDFMRSKGVYGISSTDIGVPYSIFVFGHPRDKSKTIECFNPKLISISGEMEKRDEGSLSFQGLPLKIARPNEIKVEYADRTGKINTHTHIGIVARIWLHEYDNLCKVSFTKRVSKLVLKRAIKKRNKKNAKRNQTANEYRF